MDRGFYSKARVIVDLKECLQEQLEAARAFSETLLSSFKTPEQWTHQVHAQANHALWFAGHMTVVDNFLISLIAPDKVAELPGYSEKFGPGSTPVNDPAAYPSTAEVLAAMRERRETLLSILAGLKKEDLDRPTPAGTPEFLRDWGSIFRTASWHEGVHSGQVAVARRALGHKPLFP